MRNLNWGCLACMLAALLIDGLSLWVAVSFVGWILGGTNG